MPHFRFGAVLVAVALLLGLAQLAPSSAAPAASTRSTAAAAARATGHRVEVAGSRSETSLTWANPDGTFTDELAAAPVRVRDAQGTWRETDTTLVTDASGVHPRTSNVGLRLSGGGAAPLARLITADGRSLTMDLADASLGTPALRDSTAIYEAATAGVDVRVTARTAGVQVRLVLGRRPTQDAPSWRFPLATTGLAVRLDGAGGLRLTDPSSGRLVLRADPPRMWDDSQVPASGLPRRQSPVGIRLVQVAGRPVLELIPDPAFLDDPSVTWPVTLDITPTLTTIGDTYVESDYTTSQWTAVELRSGRINSVTTRTYLNFDTNALAGRQILSATLQIYQWWAPNCTPTQTDVLALTSGWGLSTAWSNKPSQSPTVYGSTTATFGATGCPNGWLKIPITELIQGWSNGSIIKYGMAVVAHNETVNGNYKRFDSYDTGHGFHPRLVVTYSSCPVAARPTGGAC